MLLVGPGENNNLGSVKGKIDSSNTTWRER